MKEKKETRCQRSRGLRNVENIFLNHFTSEFGQSDPILGAGRERTSHWSPFNKSGRDGVNVGDTLPVVKCPDNFPKRRGDSSGETGKLTYVVYNGWGR